MAMATKSVINTMDMAATYCLSKDDVSGANLIGKSPDDLNLEQLKWWLWCVAVLIGLAEKLNLFRLERGVTNRIGVSEYSAVCHPYVITASYLYPAQGSH